MSAPVALSTRRWWLNLQLGFLLVGGTTWVVGAILEVDFVAGAGLGLMVAALALRFGRRAARREGSGEE